VSALDVVRCTEIRWCGTIGERCPEASFARPCAVKVAMGRAEAAWRKALAEQSLADVLAVAGAQAPVVPARVRQAFGRD
jgi:DNA-binding IscR family transcriptional regulator